MNKITYCNCFDMKHCNPLVSYFDSFHFPMRFINWSVWETFASGAIRLSFQSLLLCTVAELCVWTPLSLESNVATKDWRDQLALMQVVFRNPHCSLIISSTYQKKSCPYIYCTYNVFKEWTVRCIYKGKIYYSHLILYSFRSH